MRLYKRGTTWWVSFYDLRGKRHLRSTRCTDQVAARAVGVEYERGAADPAYEAARSATLQDALADLIEQREADGAAAATTAFYTTKAGAIVGVLGTTTLLADLDASAVDGYVRERAKHASQHTIHKELVLLKAALRLAKRRGRWAGDAEQVMPARRPVGYTPRTTFLSPDQARGLLEHLEPERAAWVAFVLATGARSGEAYRARREDIEGALVTMRGTKTKRAAAVLPVLAMTRDLLERALRDAPGGATGPLFRGWPNQRRDILRACERAGVPPVTANDLRRSLGTWVARAGGDVLHVAKILRHASTDMAAKVYVQLDASALGAVVDARSTVAPVYQRDRDEGPKQSQTAGSKATSKPRLLRET